MGKIRTRVIGLEEVEKEQKTEQKKRAQEKKVTKKTEKDEQVDVKVASVKEKKKEMKKPVAEVRKRGKKYESAKKQVASDKQYSVSEAVQLLKKLKYSKFDESVELHINATESGLRGEISLPHSTGKTVRVAIVDDNVLDKIANNKIDFDVLISHPSYMPKLARYAKVLGPRGLMPNPKTGTISPKPEEVAKKFESGLLKWKGEAKFPLVHMMIGKLSADDKALIENAEAFIGAVGTGKIKEVFIKSTMSPALKLQVS